MFDGIYQNKRVFVTGHTGFKGAWLVKWLETLGATVCGYALDASADALFPRVGFGGQSVIGDIRDGAALFNAMKAFSPDIVFHLAAQALVGKSYEIPAETFAVNAGGTVNVLEAVRQTPSVKAVVVVTSDKCYENGETGKPFVETDAMGGADCYSASKGCAELIVSAYRRSFFKTDVLAATARAGNVVGGGDFGEKRLVPDVMKAAANGVKTVLRHPDAVRPWQYVLDALSGYLLLGARLLKQDAPCAEAFNFGTGDVLAVGDAVEIMHGVWDKIEAQTVPCPEFGEAETLVLNAEKARFVLGWEPVFYQRRAFEETARWYKNFYENQTADVAPVFDAFFKAAQVREAIWTR